MVQAEVPPWAVRWLSQPRLAPYVRAAGAADALDLYRWNCRLGLALFELIGWFEIAWRNAVDDAISSRRRQTRHWLFDTTFPLQRATRERIARAVSTTAGAGRAEPAPGRVIAELPLGFWRFPTLRGYTTTMWAPYLSHAFPHAPRRPRRDEVDNRLQPIILLRNRIAHHEPVFGQPPLVRRTIADILELGAWINPQASRWWDRHSSAASVLAERS